MLFFYVIGSGSKLDACLLPYPSVKQDEVFPGDFIQFENVKVQFEKDGGIHTETMTQHTAVVYEVKAPGVYVIAHQNNAFSGRKMGTSELDLATVKRGKLKFYRPTN